MTPPEVSTVTDEQLSLLIQDPEAQPPGSTGVYDTYYRTFVMLREEFHRSGRYDDANVKLDEIVKLLAMRMHEERRAAAGEPDRFDERELRSLAERQFGDPSQIAHALRSLSEEILAAPEFANPDGTNVFGSHASLNIQPTDNAFALHIVQAVRALTPAGHRLTDGSLSDFDVLNESFGHFVRDSFRNNTEDAQYMTPAEVVSAMVEMAFADIEADASTMQRVLGAPPDDPFIVLDPTCGVGSFLVEGLRRVLRVVERSMPPADASRRLAVLRDRCVIGQDKVDRMVRLAKLNLMLFGSGGGAVGQGNSILNGSSLDWLHGKVDLILTNPPFGARYAVCEVLETDAATRYPMTVDLVTSGKAPASLDSELLLLDRCLSLLRPGGRLLIVLPDSVVSGRGLNASVREWIAKRMNIVGVVELPAEAFAQAGTRTKTCFLYLRKREEQAHGTPRLFMGVCDDIGFRVVARAGAQLKLKRGANELPAIVNAFVKTRTAAHQTPGDCLVISRLPSAVWISESTLLNGRWTPNFYRARRLDALASLQQLRSRGFELHQLSDVARLSSRARRRIALSPDCRTISVLHVSQDGAINLREVSSYRPKFPGISCNVGDVLVSKINPRIPRVCVVPPTPFPVACSSEFEILEPKRGLSAALLAAILVSPAVQTQIECLTSGTSSSHNRIKDEELAEILIPLPRPGMPLAEEFELLAKRIAEATTQRYASDEEQVTARDRINELLPIIPQGAGD